MKDRTVLLQRTSVESLSRYMMDASIFYTDTHAGGMTEEEKLARLRDDLEVAFQSEGEKMRERVRQTAKESWEFGETFGFMEGMRAGARIVLALIGDGETRI